MSKYLNKTNSLDNTKVTLNFYSIVIESHTNHRKGGLGLKISCLTKVLLNEVNVRVAIAIEFNIRIALEPLIEVSKYFVRRRCSVNSFLTDTGEVLDEVGELSLRIYIRLKFCAVLSYTTNFNYFITKLSCLKIYEIFHNLSTSFISSFLYIYIITYFLIKIKKDKKGRVIGPLCSYHIYPASAHAYH